MSTAAAPPAAIQDAGNARPPRPRTWLFALPAVLVTLVVLLPFLWLAVLSFSDVGSFSLVHYQRMLENLSYASILGDTLLLSLMVTGIVVVLGIPTTYFIVRQPPVMATILLACVAIPFWTSLLVRTYAWMVLLQRKGLINTWLLELGIIDRPLRMANSFSGTTIGMVHIMLPFFIFPLYSAMRQIDPDMVKAARSLGASRLRAILDVVLPQVKMSVLAGALFAFVSSLDEVVTGLLVAGGPNTVLTRMMFMSLRDQVVPTIAAISTLLIGISLVAVILFVFVERAAERPPAKA